MTVSPTHLNPRFFITVFFISLVALLSACSDSDNNSLPPSSQNSTLGVPGADNENVVPVPAALIEGPIEGPPILVGTFIDLPSLGYTDETEYLASGTANEYINVNELGSDGRWQVEGSNQVDYKTRIVVIRPSDPADFNGTVFVEWLNTSAGFDSPPDWLQAHTELIRSGIAWVGVSAQKVGIDALLDGTACAINPLCFNGDRYDNLGLNHPGDNYAYDILSQVAQAIREPGEISLLGNLKARHLIAAGESQSAGRMVSYVNAFAPIHALYDGYFIHSRTGDNPGLQQEAFCKSQANIPGPEVLRIRDDLGIPIIMVQTETDLFILGSYPNHQDDSQNFRIWEVAGTAHADLYTFLDNRSDIGTNPAIAAVVENSIPVNFPPTVINCSPFPVNSGPQHFVVNAAIRALNTWIVEGTPAPVADRLDVAGEPPAFVKDEFGNTRGGVRTPYVDARIAILEGEGQPQPVFPDSRCEIDLNPANVCFLSGTTKLLDATTLASLYEDNDAYIEELNAATDAAVSKGFLLPEDAKLIKDYAASTDIFAP